MKRFNKLAFTTGLGMRSQFHTNQCLYQYYHDQVHKEQLKYSTGFRIWDELLDSRGNETELLTRRPKLLTWYACGPTVYDSAHVGHASSYIRLDVIRRILEREGITVFQVMGVTDIDDKIISRSQLSKIPWDKLTERYETEFFRDLDKFNVKQPHIKAKVSQHIPQILHFIAELLTKNFAYAMQDGTVYFDTNNYSDHKIFWESHFPETPVEYDEAELGISRKKNPKDFALWKGAKPGEPFWEAPWGRGRPGWHIECSAIATNFFGGQLDIHSGGMDLKFPHHNNEEVQCRAMLGLHKWASYWIHTGHLHLHGDTKMSKSIGNTVSMSEYLRTKSPEVLRMICIMKKYYTNLEYSPRTEDHAVTILKKFKNFVSDCEAILSGNKFASFKVDVTIGDFWESLERTRMNIQESIHANFDTPTAVLEVVDLIGKFNRCTKTDYNEATKVPVDPVFVLTALNIVRDFMLTVGLLNESRIPINQQPSSNIDKILNNSIKFRQRVRNFSLALNDSNEQNRRQKMKEYAELIAACDDLRKELAKCGIDIKDHGKESSWSLNAEFPKAAERQEEQ